MFARVSACRLARDLGKRIALVAHRRGQRPASAARRLRRGGTDSAARPRRPSHGADAPDAGCRPSRGAAGADCVERRGRCSAARIDVAEGELAADAGAGAVDAAAGGGAPWSARSPAPRRWHSRPACTPGGSSSTVYSRIKRPRAQFTSTRKVTNGSGMASVELTNRTSRPSLLLPTLKVSDDRNGGRSMP